MKAFDVAKAMSAPVEEKETEEEDGAASKRKKVQPTTSLRDLLDGLLPYSERHF